MTTLVRAAIAFIVAIFLSSCGFDINIGDFGSGTPGDGNVITENREISGDFTEIASSEGLEVIISQENNYKIKVEADENIIDLIATDIKDGKLKIHARENIGRATKKVYVSLPEIEVLKASSGSYLKADNSITSGDLEIDGSSGARMVVELDAASVMIDASSGAHLTISGDADQSNVDVSSGGNINAKDLQVQSCNAEASSGGNVKIMVAKNLVAEASSGGNISYSGDPEVSQKKSVSGSVHQY